MIKSLPGGIKTPPGVQNGPKKAEGWFYHPVWGGFITTTTPHPTFSCATWDLCNFFCLAAVICPRGGTFAGPEQIQMAIEEQRTTKNTHIWTGWTAVGDKTTAGGKQTHPCWACAPAGQIGRARGCRCRLTTIRQQRLLAFGCTGLWYSTMLESERYSHILAHSSPLLPRCFTLSRSIAPPARLRK